MLDGSSTTMVLVPSWYQVYTIVHYIVSSTLVCTQSLMSLKHDCKKKIILKRDC